MEQNADGMHIEQMPGPWPCLWVTLVLDEFTAHYSQLPAPTSR